MALIVTLVPALAAGVGAALGLPKAVAWASDHGAAADRWAAQERAELAELQHSPLIPATSNSPAPPSLARHLLTASDLGPGWFPMLRPEATVTTSAPIKPQWAFLQAGRATLVQAHHAGGLTWTIQQTVFEDYWRFRNARSAASFRTYLDRKSAAWNDGRDSAVALRVGAQVVQLRVLRGAPGPTPTTPLHQLERMALQPLQ